MKPFITNKQTKNRTFQFTNRHGRKIHTEEKQAIFLYGNQAMKYDGEVIDTTRKVAVKNPDGSYKMTGGHYVKNKDGSYRKNNKGEYKVEGQEYVYEDKSTYYIDPEAKPFSNDSDYQRNGKVIELKSSIDKSGNESPKSSYLSKKSIK